MYKRILASVDGSDNATLALQEAIKLCKELDAKLRIVHVVDLVTVKWVSEFADLSALQESLRQSGTRILETAEAIAREAGIASETKLVQVTQVNQRIAELIADEAKTWPADLIVIGSHGHRGLHHALLGNIADGVTRTATKPVLLLRAV